MQKNIDKNIPTNADTSGGYNENEASESLFVFNEKFNNKDLLLSLIYIAWLFLITLGYFFTNKFILAVMMAKGESAKIRLFMATFDFIISIVDILFIFILMLVLKSRLAKVFFIVFFIVKIILFILGRVNI
ncbi:hypothetical protein ACI6Q2_22480 [Chitinophagaceae bacterium LWZ2-11]